jgi:cell division protein FtsB
MRGKILKFDFLKLLLAIFVLAILLTIFIVFYFPDYAKLEELRRANTQVLYETGNLKSEMRDLQEKNIKINKDSNIYEKMAREDLGVAKKDEIVIDIKE